MRPGCDEADRWFAAGDVETKIEGLRLVAAQLMRSQALGSWLYPIEASAGRTTIPAVPLQPNLPLQTWARRTSYTRKADTKRSKRWQELNGTSWQIEGHQQR